jgi:hypothetical protein
MFSTTLWPSNMKADHLPTFSSFTLPKFGKYQTTLINNFPFELWMYHTPLSYGCTTHHSVMDVPHTTQLWMYHTPLSYVCTTHHSVMYVPHTTQLCMYHTPVNRYEQKTPRPKALIESLPPSIVIFAFYFLKDRSPRPAFP